MSLVSGTLLFICIALCPLLFPRTNAESMLVGTDLNGPPASTPPVATTPTPPTVVPPIVIPPPTTLPSPTVSPPKTLPPPAVVSPPKTLLPPPSVVPPPTTTPLPPTKPTTPPSVDCDAACTARCKLSSRPNLCKRACGTCCYRCKCVPSGTAGNYEECPCYANQTTHGLQRKCP